MSRRSLQLHDEAATEAFGGLLARLTRCTGLLTLSGDLGAGKTTLCRGLIRALGHRGAVKSPTFTIVEPYELADCRVLHFDLYRLEDPEELEFLGIRDALDGKALCLVEWPEQGRGILPAPDLALQLRHSGKSREISWQAHTPRGEAISASLAEHYS